ncbi:RNA polymerase sigma factor [Sorangium sp. So ce281]|uniref:RNA polymerase sigma factor n=1 Tax=unclassified Sorangium TaxID=2621164 RepID=UPI003F5F5845
MPQLRHLLLKYGVPRQDVADVLQEVMLGAWTSIEVQARYRPEPGGEPRRALWVWLWSIAWHEASHYRGRAFRRREVCMADPLTAIPEPIIEDDPVDRLGALEGFLTIGRLPHHLRAVLRLAGIGLGPTELAGLLGVPVPTAASRLRRGRQLLGQMLTRASARTR